MITVGSLVQILRYESWRPRDSKLLEQQMARLALLYEAVRAKTPLIVIKVERFYCWVLVESQVLALHPDDLFLISSPTPMDRD